MARPKRLDENGNIFYDVNKMCEKMDEYIDECNANNDIPVLKECCLLNGWCYEYVVNMRNRPENEKLAQSIRRILDWKEVKLEKGALKGELNHTMAIFSLKQLGWRDKQEEESNAENEVANVLLKMIGANNGSNN